MVRIHFDEARQGAIEALLSLVAGSHEIVRAVVVVDLFGRVRVCAELSAASSAAEVEIQIDAAMTKACAQFWTREVVLETPETAPEDRLFFDLAWREGIAVDDADRARVNDRHRSRSAWFLPLDAKHPLWPAEEGPRVVVFHSFKGGVGRTTALAAYALAHARRGNAVAVVDMDLDAPGIGRLLDSDGEGTTARWGVLDFLLEASDELPLNDYRHTCARQAVTGDGSVDVFPAGTLDEAFLEKLGRVDLEARAPVGRHQLAQLLYRIRKERNPKFILIDGRAGLSTSAGLLLSGFAHLHVLFATTSPQSLSGLERVVHHLGYEQAQRGTSQLECVVVQAMVPDSVDAGEKSIDDFATRVEDIFRDHYFAAKPDPRNAWWSIDDIESPAAPHVPIPIRYRGTLAYFRSIDQVAGMLVDDADYRALVARLDERLALSSEEP